MNILTVTLIALALGYIIGLLQGGIHIYTGQKPVAPQKNKEPEYNESYSHMLPPEMQQYYEQNGGFTK